MGINYLQNILKVSYEKHQQYSNEGSKSEVILENPVIKRYQATTFQSLY